MPEQESFWSGWRERLTALRNVPPVLKIVWESGPAVVTGGLVFRLFASLLPMALLYVTKLIIDSIVNAAKTHQPVRPGFWWPISTRATSASG
jgi:ATP-binding cassette subfamily B protein